MLLLKYTMPTKLPFDTDCDFPVHSGTFLFFLKNIIASLRLKIVENAAGLHRWTTETDVYKEHMKNVNQLRWLESHTQLGDAIVEWDNPAKDLSDYVNLSLLVYSDKYQTAFCPPCAASYTPEQMQAMEWQVRRGTSGLLGRRLVCPKGHTLFSVAEMDSQLMQEEEPNVRHRLLPRGVEIGSHSGTSYSLSLKSTLQRDSSILCNARTQSTSSRLSLHFPRHFLPSVFFRVQISAAFPFVSFVLFVVTILSWLAAEDRYVSAIGERMKCGCISNSR